MPDLTISKLARCAGVDVETLRFYEREGLLERPERGDCGYPEEADLPGAWGVVEKGRAEGEAMRSVGRRR